eukprot:NODE_258_length_1572_cov_105.414314_g183_i0.p1 GENE.NODE_258_length_1572_cov_105.414314_g183_i0~~NODE_258_length_1572_cov_105.414314_g183_i0.p1  ORF type:complete len:236 (+),score=103.00 NODE_258_length_1572_cov_105.414314_g183_i0:179-886(+)
MAKSPKTAADVEREQREYWDTHAGEFTTPFHLSSFMAHVPFTGKILDLGCGYGRTLSELSKAGFRDLHGCDMSAGMIARGQANLPNATFQIKKSRKLPYEANTFDAVILLNLLCCVIPNSEQLRIVEEVKRVLKPNGIIYVNDFLINEEDEHSLFKYNEYKEAYRSEEFDYDYGVFDMDDGAATILCRHHDLDWIRQLLDSFVKREFEEVALADSEGNVTKSFYYIASLPEIPPV